MRRILATPILAALLVVMVMPAPTYAAPADQGCRSETWAYSPGKTAEGFEATATDGCHTYRWSGSIGQGAGSGTVTFAVTEQVNPWEGALPSMAGGSANACRARAAHEANLMFLHGFGASPGTEVTVTYRCR